MKPLGTLFMNNTTPKHIKCVVYYYLVKYIAEVWGGKLDKHFRKVYIYQLVYVYKSMISFFYLGLYKYKGILSFKKNVPIYIERVVKILQQGLVRDKIRVVLIKSKKMVIEIIITLQ